MLAEQEIIPFFGCGSHTPDRCIFAASSSHQPQVTRADRRAAKRCPTCGGRPVDDDAPFVCMGCHAVAPPLQDRFDRTYVEAIASREPDRNLIQRAVRDKAGNRFLLTPEERAELVAESPTPDLVRVWLDSIGQPAPPAAGPARKSTRRQRREARIRQAQPA